MDALFIAIMVIFILLQIPLGNAYLNATPADVAALQTLSTLFTHGQHVAYQLGMSTLGAAGLLLCYTLYKATLVPRWLAVWGLVGYAIILVGMLSEPMSSGFGLACRARPAMHSWWASSAGQRYEPHPKAKSFSQ